MSKSASASKRSEKVSERDRFWLDHHAAQVVSGQTAKEYAAAQGLTPDAFYQARKRLRTLGLLAPVDGGSKPASKPSRRKSVPADSRFRLELPGGLALEWSGGDVPESLVVLLERLVRLP